MKNQAIIECQGGGASANQLLKGFWSKIFSDFINEHLSQNILKKWFESLCPQKNFNIPHGFSGSKTGRSAFLTAKSVLQEKFSLCRCVKAFTMAEVLITLGIIGIVAAMTLPTIIHRRDTKVLETRFKKAYSNAAQALLATKFELGADNIHKSFASYNGKEYVNSDLFINEYYKHVKVVETRDYEKLPLNYTRKKTVTYSEKSGKIMDGITCIPNKVLPDGSSLCVCIWSSTISITVDVNGPVKGPNAFGHDIFMFRVDKVLDTLVGQKPSEGEPNPDAEYAETDKRPCSVKYNTAGNGLGCSYYALANECPDGVGKTYWECLP